MECNQNLKFVWIMWAPKLLSWNPDETKVDWNMFTLPWTYRTLDFEKVQKCIWIATFLGRKLKKKIHNKETPTPTLGSCVPPRKNCVKLWVGCSSVVCYRTTHRRARTIHSTSRRRITVWSESPTYSWRLCFTTSNLNIMCQSSASRAK